MYLELDKYSTYLLFGTVIDVFRVRLILYLEP